MRSRRSIDLEIAAIADRQWGIIHREQLPAGDDAVLSVGELGDEEVDVNLTAHIAV